MRWPFNRSGDPPKSILDKTVAIRNRRAMMERGIIRKELLDAELEKLIRAAQTIEGQAEWAASSPGADFSAAVADQVTRLLMQLPDAVLEDESTARTFAALIKAYANVLRIFNAPVLEYDHVRALVDKKIGSMGDGNA